MMGAEYRWASSATEKSCCALIPSYAKGPLRVLGAPVSVRLGGGAAHANLWAFQDAAKQDVQPEWVLCT